MDLLHTYLNSTRRSERLDSLKRLVQERQHIPIDLVEDLLLLEITREEKVLLVEAAKCDDLNALEDFYIKGAVSWDQDAGVVAVRKWCSRTKQRQFRKWSEIIRNPDLPQRVYYTIIDRAFFTGGATLLKNALEADAVFEMSRTVHGLILTRAIQWNFAHPRLREMALQGILEQDSAFGSEHRATIPGLIYLMHHDPEFIMNLEKSPGCPEIYKNLISALKQSHKYLQDELEKKPANKSSKNTKGSLQWPCLWHRYMLKSPSIYPFLKHQSLAFFPDEKGLKSNIPSEDTFHAKTHVDGQGFELFAGLESQELLNSLLQFDEDRLFVVALNLVGGLLNEEDQLKAKANLNTRNIAESSQLALLITGAFIHEKFDTQRPSAQENPPGASWQNQQEDSSSNSPNHRPFHGYRREFFDVALRGLSPLILEARPKAEDLFWSKLLLLWQNPDESILTELAAMVRKLGGFYTLCYLQALSRCRGMDGALLKVLDFIRSDHEDEMRAVLTALAGIATPRSIQELISALTRPNMTRNLQMEALYLLKNQDLSDLQPHLKSAYADLGQPLDPDGVEVKELLATLFIAAPHSEIQWTSGPLASATTEKGWDQTFDETLKKRIEGYMVLSSEVKRALRTSLFFHMQVDQKGTSGLIDLSPIIDMQYKALELLFRESFEDFCSQIITRGLLQRKLDFIGYARPIPQSMDQFENYLASLPVVRNIPFFSKFKLRKMLRAICQFRPGRRFTLDGLKAFALFFLCFGRIECRYGLQGLLQLGFEDDKSLFDFCHLLHVFQDMRNRAAHEGLHPEAASDIDRLWTMTGEIIAKHNIIYDFIQKNANVNLARANDSNGEKAPTEPKIIRKVS